MPNLKDLKTRIDSVKSTRKITQAMQMVAAAKLRRAEEAAGAARPYAEQFNAVMAGLAGRLARRPEASGRHRFRSDPPSGGDDSRTRPLRRLQHQHRETGQTTRQALIEAGKDGENPDGRQERPRTAEARVRRSIWSVTSTSPRSRTSATPTRRTSPQTCWPALMRRRVRRGDRLLFAVRKRDQPGSAGTAESSRPSSKLPRARAPCSTTNPTKTKSCANCCPRCCHADLRGPCWKTARPNRARG